MSDSDDSKSSSGIPAWQREQQKEQDSETQLDSEPASQETKDETPAEEKREVARRFLEDDEIKNEAREKKEEFLTSKGLSPGEIRELLRSNSATEPAHEIAQIDSVAAKSVAAKLATVPTTGPHSTTTQEPHPDISLPRNDNPPVVTYPEFLTKPTRPPPLITANGIFNTIYAFAGISTLVYGTSKFLVAPMVENLNEARTELHEATSRKLAAMIDKLESTVSEIPPTKTAAVAEPQKDDAASTSDIDDPSEMFHRDIGTQTSIPPSPRDWDTNDRGPASNFSNKTSRGSTAASAKLLNISAHVKTLKDGCVAEAEDLAHLKSEMDLLKDDLMQMAYPAPKDFTGGLYGYRYNEPDDEIKKAKDNIRRVKGVLLSTRNFPATVR